MMTLRERYLQDNQFASLVKIMVAHIQECNFTPSEMREAAILASIMYEERNISRYVIVEQEVEKALRTIRKRVDEVGYSGCNHEWWDTGQGYKLCRFCATKEIGIPGRGEG
jgi:hypothetical protein